MKFPSLERRLREIAERRGGATALLTFPDGSTRALKIRSRNGQLQLCLDAFRQMRDFPPPQTKNAAALELLGRAEKCEGPRFLQFIHGLAQTIHEGRQQ